MRKPRGMHRRALMRLGGMERKPEGGLSPDITGSEGLCHELEWCVGGRLSLPDSWPDDERA
jgi:hypothetical protein